jgi:hypothetical protein
MDSEIKLTDFIKSVSHKKNELILDADQPEHVEAQYVPYAINKVFSKHADSILHANEMNMYAHLTNDAQYRYYMNVLRPRNRYKAKDLTSSFKEEDLKLIQRHYNCNRTTARIYLKVLSSGDLEDIRSTKNTGGKIK